MLNVTTFTTQTVLTDNQMQTLAALYQSLEQILKFEEGLNVQERRRLSRPTRENLLFVNDSVDAIKQLPELCPRFLEPAEVERNAAYFHQLKYLEQVHSQAGSALADMRLILGDKCFRNALLVYQTVKSAAFAGVPKARPVYDQMNRRFATSSNNLTGSTEDDNPTDPQIGPDTPDSPDQPAGEGDANMAQAA